MFGEHAFDLYKLMVEDVREVRRARRQVSNLFITLNLAGASALGFLLRVDSGMPAALKLWLIFALVLASQDGDGAVRVGWVLAAVGAAHLLYYAIEGRKERGLQPPAGPGAGPGAGA